MDPDSCSFLTFFERSFPARYSWPIKYFIKLRLTYFPQLPVGAVEDKDKGYHYARWPSHQFTFPSFLFYPRLRPVFIPAFIYI